MHLPYARFRINIEMDRPEPIIRPVGKVGGHD